MRMRVYSKDWMLVADALPADHVEFRTATTTAAGGDAASRDRPAAAQADSHCDNHGCGSSDAV